MGAISRESSRGIWTESESLLLHRERSPTLFRSASLRQSLLLSNYETPEMRALYTKGLQNVAGKIRADVQREGVLADVPRGIKQVFTRFEASDVYSEDDARFEHFKTKVRAPSSHEHD